MWVGMNLSVILFLPIIYVYLQEYVKLFMFHIIQSLIYFRYTNKANTLIYKKEL